MTDNKRDKSKVIIALIIVLTIICGLLLGAIVGVAIKRKDLSEENTADEEQITEEAEYPVQHEDEYVSVEDITKRETERVTAKETVTSEADNTSLSSDKLTKEVLVSHSWYIEMQWKCEYVFYMDGTYESYGAVYGTGTYTIKGDMLYFDNHELKYTTIAECEDARNDEYFIMSFARNNNVKEDEKILYTTDKNKPMWLVDTKGRFECDRDYSIFRTFTLEENDYYDEYSYFGFALVDLNNDGRDELVCHRGTCENDRTYSFYTVKNKEVVLIGTVNAWHAGLAEGSNGVIKYTGISGEGEYYRISMQNGEIIETKLGEYSFPPVPDFGTEVRFDPMLN